MSAIPQHQISVQDLQRWYTLKKQLDQLKWQESELRRQLFGHFFPSPVEGSGNKMELGDGYILQAEYTISRKVLQPQLQALQKTTVGEMADQLKNLGINVESVAPDTPVLQALNISVDNLLKYEPELKVREYRALTEPQRQIFEMVLEIKPGSPTLKIVPTAEKKRELEAAAAPVAPPPVSVPAPPIPGIEIPQFVKTPPF